MRAPPLLLLMAAASLAAGPLARRNPWMSACDLDTDPEGWGRARCETRCSTDATLFNTDAVLRVCKRDKNERIETMNSMRLVTCCERSPAEALDAGGRTSLKASFEVCNATLHELIELDSLANDMHCTFVNLLVRYDCQQSYSVRHSCSNCQDTYRRWVCSSLLPYFANDMEIKKKSSEGARSRRNAPGDRGADIADSADVADSADDQVGSEVQSEQTQSEHVDSETRTVHFESETVRQDFVQRGARHSHSDKYFGQRHSDSLKPNTFRKKDDSSSAIGDLSSFVSVHSNAYGIESITNAEYIYERTSSAPEDNEEFDEESKSIALITTSKFYGEFRKGNSNTQARRKTREQWSNQNKRRGNRSSNRESTDPWLGVNKANLSSKMQRSRRKGRHKKDGENENPPELLRFIANSTSEDGRSSAELVGPRSGRWRRAAAAGPGRPDPDDSSVWRIKPCISICQEVEQKCPYFLPGDKAPASSNQYAGEPTFICLDPNIPETGEQKQKSNYGLEDCCYQYCGENSSSICVQCEAPTEETLPEAEICYPILERQSTCSLIQNNSNKRNTSSLNLIIILALCAYFGYRIQDVFYLNQKPSSLKEKSLTVCVRARLPIVKSKCKSKDNSTTPNKKHLYVIGSVNDSRL